MNQITPMCGRFALSISPLELARQFDLPFAPDFQPRFNIAPTQMAPVIHNDSEGKAQASMLRWGLVPSWSKDLSMSSRMINARGETVAEKPSFRSAIKKRRCLVPASGYYEWQAPRSGAKQKQPYFILPTAATNKKPPVLALAGLWERRIEPADGSIMETFAIITIAANAKISAVHDRMPVVLARTQYGDWLDHTQQDREYIDSFIKPATEELLSMYPVSTYVNSPRNDDPQCVKSINDGELYT